ncbi:hypothetical protein [Lujinxingia litoralis]|uniref:hypothetical protein n=1 Tax=Lujinxingia litoralis TaxID=2211119 RepID=UPI0011B94602|nr:hypothetical protein [Lujinxingia litoralis]
MKHHLFILFCALTTACSPSDSPRALPIPILDAAAIFPTSVPSPGTESSHIDSTHTKNRYRQLAQTRPETTFSSRVRVSLGANLTAELPDNPQRWHWSRKQDLTLISYQQPKQPPELLIITQPFSTKRHDSPSRALRSFLSTSILELTATNTSTLPSPSSTLLSSNEHLGAIQTLQSFFTTGRGLGFLPSPNTFSGWRHIGITSEGLLVRLGHYQGTWSPQLSSPSNLSSEDISSLPKVLSDKPANNLEETDIASIVRNALPLTTSPQPSSLRPARLYLGTVESSPTQGIHLVLICTNRTSTCPQALSLRHLLNSLSSIAAPSAEPTLAFTEHIRAVF